MVMLQCRLVPYRSRECQRSELCTETNEKGNCDLPWLNFFDKKLKVCSKGFSKIFNTV